MMWSGLATTCVAAMLLPILLPQPAVFRENRLEVTYTLPAGLVPEPDGRNLLDRAKEAATVPGDKVRLSCLSIPLRMKSPTDLPYERLVVFETNLDCLDRGLPDIAEVAGTTMRTLMGEYNHDVHTQAATYYSVRDHSAAWATATVRVESLGPGVTLYSGMSCVLVEHSIVCWNVVSSDPARLPKLLATQIQFDGHKPASLVPKWALNTKVQP